MNQSASGPKLLDVLGNQSVILPEQSFSSDNRSQASANDDKPKKEKCRQLEVLNMVFLHQVQGMAIPSLLLKTLGCGGFEPSPPSSNRSFRRTRWIDVTPSDCEGSTFRDFHFL